MIKISTDQELEICNLLCFRGKARQNELDGIEKDMTEKINASGGKCLGNPIIATFGVDGKYFDIEVLLPIDKNVGDVGQYRFKEKIKLVNAVVASYTGNPIGLQSACDKLNQYVAKKQLQPITVGYNVTKHIDPTNADNTEIDIWLGINPNTL